MAIGIMPSRMRHPHMPFKVLALHFGTKLGVVIGELQQASK